MKKCTAVYWLVVFASLLVFSCSKQDEQTLSKSNNGNNAGGCDTINMKFAADIQPILETACYGCHGFGQFQNGVNLETYARVKAQVDNGNLMGAITHAPGYPPMPDGAPKLSDCNINKVKDWINNGALNN